MFSASSSVSMSPRKSPKPINTFPDQIYEQRVRSPSNSYSPTTPKSPLLGFRGFKKSQNNPLLIPRKAIVGDFSTIYNDIVPKKIKIEDLNNDQLLDLTVLVLQKPYEIRTNQDIRLILKTTSNYEYFKTYDKETHEQICRYMTHYFLQKDEILCEIGSKGSTFYIILKGTVEVWVLIPRDIEEIDENGEIIVKNTKVLTHVKNLTVGQSFGELALMEKKPRAARIVCAEDCDFAVLDKQHFDKILKEKEQKKLYEKIDFFASMKLFANWSYNSVKLLYYQTSILKFKRGQMVFKQNSVCDGVYLIKSGQYKVSTKLEMPIISEENHTIHLKEYEISIVGAGEILAEEETINSQNMHYSVYCISEIGELFYLNKKEFMRKVFTDDNTKLFLLKSIKDKQDFRKQRIYSIQTVERKKIQLPPKTKYFNEKRLVQKQNYSTNRISNKDSNIDSEYESFKLESAKRQESWEKYQSIKVENGFKSKTYLSKLMKTNVVTRENPFKRIKTQVSFDKNLKKEKINDSKKKLFDRAFTKYQSFIVKTLEINDNIPLRTNSSKKKIEREGSEKFKKSINNIFMHQFKKNRIFDIDLNKQSFLNVSSKKINIKII